MYFQNYGLPKKCLAPMPKMSRFRGSVEKHHGKCAQTLFKFGGQLLYYVY